MLKGHIALVTGGGSGIGRATCQLFAEEGASVVAADINLKTAEETVLSLTGSNHLCVKTDVSKTEDIDCGLAKIRAKYSSPPSIVVNCAGLVIVESFLDMTEKEYYKLMDVNVKGTMIVTQRVCRELISVGKKGSIINISSVAAVGVPSQALYSATKAAIDVFSKAAAKEMITHGIRINSVLPGLVKTSMVESVPEEVLKTYVPPAALSRPADPKEIAEVILFLASDRSSYVNAGSYAVNGGLI